MASIDSKIKAINLEMRDCAINLKLADPQKVGPGKHSRPGFGKPSYIQFSRRFIANNTRNLLARQNEAYGFTVVLSADDKTRKKIQSKLLELIGEMEPIVIKAPSQDVYQLSLDLFSWTAP